MAAMDHSLGRMIDSRDEFAARLPVLTPGDDGYDDARTGFQLFDPHRPAVLVAATDSEQVRTAVELAGEHGLPLAVQATGHGRAVPTEGVLINTRRMSGVRVDPKARTAWVEAGAPWRAVIDAAAPHGLAPLSGSLPGVGAISYTLGGGVGVLARRYGFAADHVRRIDLVTPDAEMHRVTADSDAELFWALRGGGGGLGVVTGMEIDLVPVARIYGGNLVFDIAQVPDAMSEWARWTVDLPDEMTSAAVTLTYPDLPVMPERLRGRQIARLQICYAGSAEEGARLVAPLRRLGPILQDTLRELPFTESGAVFDEPERPHAYRGRNVLVDALDPDDLAGLTKVAAPSASVMTIAGVRHLGGALAREPGVPNAVGHRDAAYSVSVLSLLLGDETAAVAAVHRAALAPFAPAALGISRNFTFGPVDDDEFRRAFAPDDHARLTELVRRFDPRGMLR